MTAIVGSDEIRLPSKWVTAVRKSRQPCGGRPESILKPPSRSYAVFSTVAEGLRAQIRLSIDIPDPQLHRHRLARPGERDQLPVHSLDETDILDPTRPTELPRSTDQHIILVDDRDGRQMKRVPLPALRPFEPLENPALAAVLQSLACPTGDIADDRLRFESRRGQLRCRHTTTGYGLRMGRRGGAVETHSCSPLLAPGEPQLLAMVPGA